MAGLNGGTYTLTGADVLLPGGQLSPKAVTVASGRIAGIDDPGTAAGPSVDLADCVLSPGFVDIHLNGCGGASFESATPDAIETILDTGLRFGTTSVVGALNTAERKTRIQQLEVMSRHANVAGQATLLGAHLEGPYYHPDQRGAHHPEWIRDPDPAEYGEWIDRFGALVRVVTLAPELPGGMEAVRALSEAGIVASIGHSMATDAQVEAAIQAGASMVTHIYNAQSTFTREDGGKHLGVAEMGLMRDELTVEIIPDNRHLTPRMQALVVKLKPHRLTCITTDAMEATGMGPGTYEVMGGTVWVDDEVAYREDRRRHAGSILTMDRGVRNVVRAGASVGAALMMATEVPARTVGAERKGRIVTGADADLVVLSRDLRVLATVCAGRVAFEGEDSPLGALAQSA